jgi:putative polymerase
VIVMADARFGLYSCIVMTLLYPFYHLIARSVWMCLPFLFLTLLAIYGLDSGTHGGPNDISGRFQVTAYLLTQLNLNVVLGTEVTSQFTADSGLAYTLTQFGIFGFIALWGTFVFAPAKSTNAWKFHSMAIIYYLLLLIISNSGYSIKTAALFWFILGTANSLPGGANQSLPQALSNSPGRKRALS